MALPEPTSSRIYSKLKFLKKRRLTILKPLKILKRRLASVDYLWWFEIVFNTHKFSPEFSTADPVRLRQPLIFVPLQILPNF